MEDWIKAAEKDYIFLKERFEAKVSIHFLIALIQHINQRLADKI